MIQNAGMAVGGFVAALFAEVTISGPTFAVVLSIVFGGGGAIALYQARAQRNEIEERTDAISVTASKEAVAAVRESLAEVRAELAEARRELQEKEERYEAAIRAGLAERERLKDEVAHLRVRVADLEETLRMTRRAVDRGELPTPYQGPERRQPPDSP